MKYVPLRNYSIYSRGCGVIDPKELGDFLDKHNINFMAVSDPFSMKSWESFRCESDKRGLKALLGIEIRIKSVGSLVLYPVDDNGYRSIVQSYNTRLFSKMDNVIAVYIPCADRSPSIERFARRINRYILPQHLFIGLSWRSPKWVIELARHINIPLVWAQAMKWVQNPVKFAVASAVFKHYSLADLLKGSEASELSLYGPINDKSILKRWGSAGIEAMKNTFVLAGQVHFNFTSITSVPLNDQNHHNALNDLTSQVISKKKLTEIEHRRVSKELNAIDKHGFSFYFLIAMEIGTFCIL